ncbi:ICE-like protease (caspase) p20 domain protein [Rhizoctonia solani AG-3 Rhs1AP]|uniref:ICE-like protease (Caspase) p20 domain protein n=2 Tax=Rhizoctonia solani AG-3 TaxID=1086053 RepID=A0A074RVD7_9AGAM|nr:ICE-like protease (caspase) p20 domain protein [Rhizoctonia solani AG-3 Rhs1AP]KEP50884.1 ICE-like protease (caspase) p20 domain protein [Rhizoctonia solani 123E]
MPPSLSLGSLVRTPSLNRHSRGRPTSATSESLSYSTEWLHFGQYTGEKSTLPCVTRALVVGVEYLEGQKFEDGVPMYLAGCHADTSDILDLLRKSGDYSHCDIRVLADVPGLSDNQRPTRENIVKGLHWLSEGCRSGDRRFFHYAGHGTQVQDKDGDEEDGYDEAIQPADWATKYERGDEGLILDDEFRDFLVDPLPGGSTLTAVVDCCHSGTILDMEQETRAVPTKSQTLGPMPRGSISSVPSRPSLILKMRFCRSASGSILPVGNILELPELANVKNSDEPVTPGAERGAIAASESVVLEMKNVEGPIKKRVYNPIVANVVCWSACLDSQLAWNKPEEINDRGVLTSAFTSGMRGAAAKYNAMPGAFHPEQRAATYAELFDYIREQERLAYMERKDRYEETHLLYQDPQLWISASMGYIMDRPVII